MTNDQAKQRATIEAALRRVPSEGFTEAMLRRAAADAGTLDDVARLFPHGAASLLEAWSHGVDAEMEARLDALALAAMPVRKRIRTAVLTRLAILKPDKDAVRRAAAYLGAPANAPLAARLAWAGADAMWHAAGDRSTDFNYYTKRGILAGVHTATVLRWLADATADERETQAFLDARIANVLQYEKLKAQVRDDAKKAFERLAWLLRPSRGV